MTNLPTPPSNYSAWPMASFWSQSEVHFNHPEPHFDPAGLAEFNLITLRDLVLFPRMTTPLIVGREHSLRALNDSAANNRPIMVVAQRNPADNDPIPADLFTVGVEIALGQLLHLPDGTTSVIVRGLHRLQITEFIQHDPFFRVRALRAAEPATIAASNQVEAMMRAALSLFERVVGMSQHLPEEAFVFALNIPHPGALADLIATTLNLTVDQRQPLLETIDPLDRLQKVITLMGRELDVLELEDRIHSQIQNEMDRAQREMYLREQLRTIQMELGEGDPFSQEINDLRGAINRADLPDEHRAAALREVDRLQQMPPMAPETGIIRTYLEWLLALPWATTTEDNLDLTHAQKVLDASHYGLPKVKERVLEYLAVRQLAPDRMRQPIMCFLGPPGTGKTSIGQAIADALGRKFVRLSLGGVRDEAEIRGHRRTYIGALPGRILQTLRRVGTANPVFMLDEVDKLGADYRGDPSSALLEVLDPEQNHSFSDHYLSLPYDLAKVLFITTANYRGPIPWALQDRMELIEFSGYVEPEKVAIARQFLIPKQLQENGLRPSSVTFADDTLNTMIRSYTYEAGVREFDRQLAQVCRKIAFKKAKRQRLPRTIRASDLSTYLGPPQYADLEAEREDTIGVAMGLAWTAAGGDITPIEVMLIYDSKGRVQLTGQIGEVMRESWDAGFTWLRAHARELEIHPDHFEKTDIHIHLPEGAIRKDGPSAGITLITAVASALTGRKVRRDVGMTGEITLRGNILPIGGLREKLLAAHRAGLKIVIIPAKNEKDLQDIPPQVTAGLDIRFVNTIDEVLAIALLPPPVAFLRRPHRYRPYRRVKPHNSRPNSPTA